MMMMDLLRDGKMHTFTESKCNIACEDTMNNFYRRETICNFFIDSSAFLSWARSLLLKQIYRLIGLRLL